MRICIYFEKIIQPVKYLSYFLTTIKNELNIGAFIFKILIFQQFGKQMMFIRIAICKFYNIKIRQTTMDKATSQTSFKPYIKYQYSISDKNKQTVKISPSFLSENKQIKNKAFSPNARVKMNHQSLFLDNNYKEKAFHPSSSSIIEPKQTENSRNQINKKLEIFKGKMSAIEKLFLNKKPQNQQKMSEKTQTKSLRSNYQNFQQYPCKGLKRFQSFQTKVSFSEDSLSNIPQSNSFFKQGYLELKQSIIIPQVELKTTLVINGRKQHFKIMKFINQGCYGKVHLVKNIETNFICCLKTLKKEGITDEIKSQVIREIKIQSFLSHPNIVTMYGFAHDSENIYLLLEPCLDGNLFDLIKNQKEISEKEVVRNVKEVCNALDYMHGMDIIHRDIKPENILLHHNTIKICDFGWAVHSHLLRRTCCGTPIYLSPEVLSSQLYDNKVDVWAVGILTYQLLCKKIPFQIKTLEDLSKIMTENINLDKEIALSQTSKDFISLCLHKDPRTRPAIFQLCDHEFLNKQISRFRQTFA